MTTPKLSPAAIYARYSSEMQDDMSISSQIKECTEWAEKNGYYIVAIYTDEATSGTIARDGLNELKTAISSPKCPFEAVIAWKASRIARDVELATGFRGYLRRRNIKLLFVADPNLDGPMSIIVDSILDGFNAFFIEDLAANVLRGQKQWASLGYAPPGNPPYGYKKIPVDSNSDRQKYKYEPIPEQAAILRWMFQQYADGVPLTKIAIELKEKGIKTQNNTPWTCSKIWKLMFAPQRAAYSGSIIFNKKGRNKPEPGDKRPRRNQKTFIKPESEWIVVENAHPPIIEQELFDAVDKMRFGKPERIVFRERMRSGKISMLSGMIRCHNCGHLYGRGLGGSKGHKRYYYKCSAKMHFKDNPYLY
jgi:site-specific DNA recombinase